MSFFARHRSAFLLGALLFAILSSPLLGDGERGAATLVLGSIVALLIGVGGYLISSDGRWIAFYCALAGAVVTTAAFDLILSLDVGMAMPRNLAIAAMQAGALYVSLRYALNRERGHALDRIIGGICGYFLIGLLWSRFFVAIQLRDGDAFTEQGAVAALNEADLVYFSFASLTTLGYGDIAPLNSFARILATLESAFGVLYLAVLVAALVSELQGMESSRDGA